MRLFRSKVESGSNVIYLNVFTPAQKTNLTSNTCTISVTIDGMGLTHDKQNTVIVNRED